MPYMRIWNDNPIQAEAAYREAASKGELNFSESLGVEKLLHER